MENYIIKNIKSALIFEISNTHYFQTKSEMKSIIQINLKRSE